MKKTKKQKSTKIGFTNANSEIYSGVIGLRTKNKGEEYDKAFEKGREYERLVSTEFIKGFFTAVVIIIIIIGLALITKI